MKYPHVAARLFDTPLLVSPGPLRAFLSALGPRMGFEVVGVPAQPRQKAYADDDGSGGGSGYVVENGVARLPILGPLIHRVLTMEDMCEGYTGYTDLTASFRAAMADPRVRAVLLEIDSPGGEVSGVFDLADEIYAARGTKPIVAVVVDMACSAAYLLASAADEIVTTQTGWTGSVGVVWTHVDISAANEQMGIAVTHIFAGDHKVDGTPFAPLPDAVRAEFQASVDKTYQLFVDKVSRNRGMSAEAVIATQADVYAGDDGVTIGFADRVGTLKDTMDQLAELSRPLAASSGATRAVAAHMKGKQMTTTVDAAAGDQSAHEATIREMESRHATALTEVSATASRAAKERCKAILGSEEAKGCEAQAQFFAFDTDMPADQAVAALKVAPKSTVAAANRFDAAMAANPNPQVGDGGGAKSLADDPAAVAKNIVSLVTPRKGAA